MSLLGISKKGKWIIGGVCAFAVVATATTGLAAWVIGQNTDDNTNGQMNVATVNDKSVTLIIDETAENSEKTSGSDLTVLFGPNGVKPTTGTPVVTASNGNEEDMRIMVRGSYEVVNKSTTVAIGAKISLSQKAQDLITSNYIALPEGSGTTATEVTVESATRYEYSLADFAVDASKKTFSKEYLFKWGSAFEGKNPCEYFDGTTEDKDKGYNKASQALTTLYASNASDFTITVFVK